MQVPPFSLSKQLSDLGNDLDAAALRVLRSGQYIGGQEVKDFEESFAANVGVPYVVGCNSGTDALILGLRALEIGVGDEVITCSFSFFATAEAISAVGAKPVFVEVDPSTFLIDLDQLEDAITKNTKAILPVHLFGYPVNMERILCIAEKYGLKVIEDCAQASGAKWSGRDVGSWGDVGCFSFFPTKNLGAAGDAGAVVTKDGDLAKKIRELAVHGMSRRYVHTDLGYNSRLDALQAAILNIKLPHLSNWVANRALVAERYIELLKNLPGLELPHIDFDKSIQHGWNQFVVKVIDFPEKEYLVAETIQPESHDSSGYLLRNSVRSWLQENLKKQGINTIIYYPIPIHLQPAYKNLGYQVGSLPVTESICSQVLSLPIFPEISLEQQKHVVKTLRELMTQ